MLCRQLLGRRLIVGEVVNQRCGHHCWVIVAVGGVVQLDEQRLYVVVLGLSWQARGYIAERQRGGNTAKPTDVRRLDKGAVVVVPGFDGFEAHVGKDFIEVNYEGESARINDGKVDFS